MTESPIAVWADRLGRFNTEARLLLSMVESSSERRYSLDRSYDELKGLSLKQDELFRQALRCVELGVFRAAHVMSWCGFFDCILCLLASDGFLRLKTARPNWQVESSEGLTESYSEHQILEALKPAGIFGKADQKALIGLLSRRNECAHPTDYFPGLNQTLGYISELFDRIVKIEAQFPAFKI
jgi:hypothetical protein